MFIFVGGFWVFFVEWENGWFGCVGFKLLFGVICRGSVKYRL